MLSTVNAPYRKQLDGAGLARCLGDFDLAKAYSGQISSFLGEVPVDDQIAFAAEHGIGIEALKQLASKFGAWAGESYKLAA